MRKALVLVAAVLLLAGCGGVEQKQAERLPDASLAALRGSDQPVNLRDLRGPMVVNLWANWCTPCRREMPIYERFHTAHPGVQVLGVNWRDPARDKALAVVRETGVTYPLVVDEDGSRLAARGLPKLILLDATGHVAFQAYVEITSLRQLEGLVHKHLGVDL